MKKRLLIIDDHRLVLDALSAYLSVRSDIEVICSECRSTALDVLKREGPFDAVMVDLCMPDTSGLQTLKTFVEANGNKPVVVFSGFATYVDLITAQSFGVHSFMKKKMPASQMVDCIQRILENPNDIPECMQIEAATPVPALFEGKLSRAECNLLCLAAAGTNTAALAVATGMNTQTVSNQMRSICRKLRVNSRGQAVSALMEATA